jgi:hypothetical protein
MRLRWETRATGLGINDKHTQSLILLSGLGCRATFKVAGIKCISLDRRCTLVVNLHMNNNIHADTYDLAADGPTRHGPRKRRKITRSKSGCLHCRRRKKRCDMTRPVCESCSKLQVVSHD